MKAISVDFDGVIHAYSKGWMDGSIYDQPIPGAFAAIRTYMEQGYAVYILSTRRPRDIKNWLDKHLWFYDAFTSEADDRNRIFGYLPEVIPWHKKFWDKPWTLGITRRKLPAIVYIDDRAVRFDGSWEHPEKLLDLESRSG